MAKYQNIQQLKFAGGEPPNNHSTDLKLMYGRAEGIPSFLESMVVRVKVITDLSI